jgi:hypothetical protein
MIKSLISIALATTLNAQAEVASPQLGKGHHSHAEKTPLRDECIEFDPRQVVTEEVRTSTYHMIHIKNREELSDRIRTSGGAKASYGFFSGEAKASFLKQIEWNSNSNYILVQATRFTQRQYANQSRTRIKSAPLNLLRDQPLQFIQTCGDTFITSVELGGEIYGVIEIKSETFEEKQRISASLSASGNFFGGSASAKGEYERNLRRLFDSYRAKVDFRHVGGIRVQTPQTPERLLELSVEIENISDPHPVVLSVNTREYLTAENYPIQSRDPELEIRQIQIEALESKILEIENLSSKIVYILENQDDFRKVNESTLLEKLGYLRAKKDALRIELRRGRSFTHAINPNAMTVNLNIELPEMRWTAARKPLKVSCETRKAPICGIEVYQEKVSNMCTPLSLNVGAGPVCGTLYKVAESAACGVKRYKTGTGPVCGVKEYIYKRGKQGGFLGTGPREKKIVGVKSYHTCEDASFGIEYNSCSDKSHGEAGYQSCQHLDFGYAFASCRHFSHGAESYKSCSVTRLGDQESLCPKF